MDLETYKRFLNASGGSVRGAVSNSTKKNIVSKFSDHPSFTYVDIDGISTGVRLMDGNNSNIKKIVFQPETEIFIGDFVEISERTWLITDFIPNEPAEIFPSAEIKLCNNYLEWIDDSGTSRKVSCVIENQVSTYQEVNSDRYGVSLPSDTLMITTKFTSVTNRIEYFQRFMFDNNRAWRVNVIDNISKVYDGVGVIQFLVKAVPLKQSEISEDHDVTDYGYEIVIMGNEKVEINTSASYDAFVYLDGDSISESVTWSVDNEYLAEIDSNGVLTTHGEAGKITIIATYEEENITGEKIVQITDSGDWW